MHWLVASLACQYGWDPEAILDWSPTMLEAVLMVDDFRAKEAERASRRR